MPGVFDQLAGFKKKALGAAGVSPGQLKQPEAPPLQESAYGKVIKSGQFQAAPGQDPIAAYQAHQAEMENRAALPGRLRAQATDYRAGLGQTQDRMMTGQGEDARRGLADRIQNIQSNANSRGLLYSGGNQAAQQQAASDTSGQLQAGRARINEQTNARADAYDQMATEGSLDNQDRIMAQTEAKQKESDANYDIALKKRMGEKSNFEKGGAALGSVAGILTAGGAR